MAVKAKAMRRSGLRQAVVDTAVQEKAVTFPTDAKLNHRARERLVRRYRATIWMRRAAIKVRMGRSPSPMMIAVSAVSCKQFLLSD